MELLPPDEVQVSEARQALPPLIKGYLRLGGFVGDGAVVDPEFGTTDVCVVVKTDLVTKRYLRHYKRDEQSDGDRDGVAGHGPGGGACRHPTSDRKSTRLNSSH